MITEAVTSTQAEDVELQSAFKPLAKSLADNEEAIVAELKVAQGQHVDLGGYYQPDVDKITKAMRPSAILNGLIDTSIS